LFLLERRHVAISEKNTNCESRTTPAVDAEAMPAMHRLFHLSCLGALATFASEVGAMFAVTEEYNAAGCASGNLVQNKEMKKVDECMAGDGDTSWKITCMGQVATVTWYNGTACQTQTATAIKACEASDAGSEFLKCADESLGTYTMWKSDTCMGTGNQNANGLFRAMPCIKASEYKNGAWSDMSEKFEISSDGKTLTSTDHSTLDCTGIATNENIYTCGSCTGTNHTNPKMIITYPGCGDRVLDVSMSSEYSHLSLLMIAPLVFVGARASSM